MLQQAQSLQLCSTHRRTPRQNLPTHPCSSRTARRRSCSPLRSSSCSTPSRHWCRAGRQHLQEVRTQTRGQSADYRTTVMRCQPRSSTYRCAAPQPATLTAVWAARGVPGGVGVALPSPAAGACAPLLSCRSHSKAGAVVAVSDRVSSTACAASWQRPQAIFCRVCVTCRSSSMRWGRIRCRLARMSWPGRSTPWWRWLLSRKGLQQPCTWTASEQPG